MITESKVNKSDKAQEARSTGRDEDACVCRTTLAFSSAPVSALRRFCERGSFCRLKE